MKGVIAFTAGVGGTEFALSLDTRAPARTGVLDRSDSAAFLRPLVENIVIGDYGLGDSQAVSVLLGAPAQLWLAAPRVTLMPPLTAAELLDTWSEGRVRLAADAAVTAPFLRERRLVKQRLQQVAGAIENHVRGVSAAYADLLTHHGDVDPRLFQVVFRYPTPRMLHQAGPLELSRCMKYLPDPARRRMVDALTALGDQAPLGPREPGNERFIWTVVRGLIGEYRAQDGLVHTLDQSIFDLAGGDRQPAGPRVPPDPGWGGIHTDSELSQGVAVRHISSRGLTLDSLPEDVKAPEDILNFVRSLQGRLHESPSPADAAFAMYKTVRRTHPVVARETLEAVEIEQIGQRLALAAGDLCAAVTYRDQARAREAAATQSSPSFRADATLLDALTTCETVDLTAGANALRSALESDVAASADPYLLTEVRGYVALLLAMVGQRAQCVRLLDINAAQIAAHGGSGSSRAATDIAWLLVSGVNVGRSRGELGTLLAAADRHSEGTAYRSYFHYVVMVTTYISGTVDLAISSFASIRHENRWDVYGSLTGRAAQVSYAVMLAARGQFGGARAELSQLTQACQEDPETASETLIHRFLERRIDLAAGILEDVLNETSPRGLLWAEQVRRTHPRYVPASLSLRGTALWRTGMEDSAKDHFQRALVHSVLMQDFTALAVVETIEFRNWLAGLDRDQLPDGVPGGVYDDWLSGPVLISLSIPKLTPQQSQILQRLAIGRSTAAIASELGVSTNTMKTHLRHLYRRLGASTRLQAVTLAEDYGLIR